MDEDVGVGVGPSERAQHAGGGGPTPGHRRRMSARRKQDAVLRLLRGEDLELVSRELAVTAAELSGWREAFLAAGEASLKSRPADARDDEIGRLKEKVGDLTMANELLEAKIERLEAARTARRSAAPGATSGAAGGGISRREAARRNDRHEFGGGAPPRRRGGGHRGARLGWSCKASPGTEGDPDDYGEIGIGRADGKGRLAPSR